MANLVGSGAPAQVALGSTVTVTGGSVCRSTPASRAVSFVLYSNCTAAGSMNSNWLAKDSMRRSFEPDLETYRVKSTPRAETHMRRQH